MNLLDYLNAEEGKGYPCPRCDSSDALFIKRNRPDHTPPTDWPDTGFCKCFSCQWWGSGIDYLTATGQSRREAMQALGVSMGPVDVDEARRRTAQRTIRRECQRKTKRMCLTLARGGRMKEIRVVGAATKKQHALAERLCKSRVLSPEERREIMVKVEFGDSDLVGVALEWLLETVPYRKACWDHGDKMNAGYERWCAIQEDAARHDRYEWRLSRDEIARIEQSNLYR